MSDTAPPAVTRRLRTMLCWTAALLPTLFGLAVQVQGGRVKTETVQKPLPGLAFSQYLVNDRNAGVQPYYRAYFRFRNTGASTVNITDLEPSCGCLNPQLTKREYGPGERGEFYLKIDPTQQSPGEKEYYVDVRYTDPEPRVARVTYKIVIPERKVEITPGALIFYQLADDGEETSQDVVISDYRTRHFNVVDIESTSPLVRVELLNKREDEAGNRHIDLKVFAAGHVPEGTSRAIVNITTDDPVFQRLQLPIIVRGPTLSVPEDELPLRPDPKSLYMIAKTDGSAEGSLTLHEIAAEPIVIRSAKLLAAHGDVSVGPVQQSVAGPVERYREVTVKLSVPEGSDDVTALLVLETDAPKQPRVEIPVVVERRASAY